MSNKRCKNCNQVVEHKFCAHCGQKVSVEALTFTSLFKEMSDNIFQINHGLFFSIKEFTLRPAESVNNYLIGKRKQYLQPIAYAFTLATLFFIVAKLTGDETVVEELFEGYLIGMQETGEAISGTAEKTIKWVSENYAFSILLTVPIFSLASYVGFFNGRKNYLEHLVLNLYITGHQSIIYGISALIGVFAHFGEFREPITVFISVSYALWVLTSFFKQKHIVLRLLQACFVYLFSFMLLALILGAGFSLI